MKKLVVFILISFLILSCDSDNSVEADGSVKSLSYKSNDCYSDAALSKKNYEPYFGWNYKKNILYLNCYFQTLCEAAFTDSVKVEENKIEIFLTYANEDAAKCVCEYKEDFEFEVTGFDKLEVKLNYKSFQKESYETLLDQAIYLNQ
ncbi:MAG: hypothetical protein JEY94_18090 [Melioribacteraceae bacterium]|nr:hypothetical protein [Melioribacteraceae bacterium]